jgi:methylated-DNA-[protein]-cysteine S-methyltransferase
MNPETYEWMYPTDTPLGPLLLTFTLKGLAGLDFAVRTGPVTPENALPAKVANFLKLVRKELHNYIHNYFAYHSTNFRAVPLDLKATAFQLRVWEELRKIPWGATISYGEMARRVGRPQGPRAVGQAIGANPVAIIIPCHRVIAAHGKLGGYGGGLDRKRWLLAHEGVMKDVGGGPGT